MDLEIAAGYGECSVCFGHLCAKGASVMVDGSGQQARFLRAERPPRRVCRHFLCQECAPTIIPRKCPVCRRDFVSTVDVPDPITDPVRWFHVVDRDQNGSIEESELVDALKGMFPVEPGALEELIHMNWRSWDTMNSGTLDTAEFRNRLAPFLAQSIGNMRQRITPQLPDLKDQPAEWFKYWDEDESGSLERPEIVRALIKTIPEFTGRDEGWLGGTFAAIWSVIDPDEGGSITGAEFMMPGGLYETIVANVCRHRIDGATGSTSQTPMASAAADSTKADREVLQQFLRFTSGESWTHQEGWAENADDFGGWDGVTTNAEGRVVKLELLRERHPFCLDTGINVNGAIPPELGRLGALEVLDLRDNKLSGIIPPELGGLVALEVLNLRDNKLSGIIPPELGGLVALRVLNLRDNKLSGIIPPELGGLVALRVLNLRDNKLSGIIPPELGGLVALRVLNLRDNKLSGFVPAQLVKLYSLQHLVLGGNQLRGTMPSRQQLENLRDVLAPPVYRREESEQTDTGKVPTDEAMVAWEIVNTGSAEDGITTTTSGTTMPTSGKAERNKAEGSAKPRSEREAATTEVDRGTVIDAKMATILDFDGYVVAWSFGDRPEVLRSHDFEFELEVPGLGRNVPALIGHCASSAEAVDGKQCLLNPVVTCLARAGESFDPPLRLRFPVGDVESMESGSDCGSDDDAEVAYRAYLESTFSALTREDASSEWFSIDGAIVQTEEGVFVLEVMISHFCDFALKQDINVEAGGVELVLLPRLRRKTRRSHYHFLNLGTENLMVFCWGAVRKRDFLDSFRLKVGVGPTSGDAEVEATRTRADMESTGVYNVGVPGKPLGERRKASCLWVDGSETLTVAHTTQETIRPLIGNTHDLVQVWGRRCMQHKYAMIFGSLTGSMRLVPNLKVVDAANAGKLVKSKVEGD